MLTIIALVDVSLPFVTTLVDATGLFIYFTLAKLILGI